MWHKKRFRCPLKVWIKLFLFVGFLMFYYWFWHINSRRVYQKLLWILVFLCLYMFTLSVSCGVFIVTFFSDYLSGPILSSGYFCYFVKPLRLCQADNYEISLWLCSSLSEAYSYTCLFVNRRGTQYLFEKLHIILISIKNWGSTET